VMRALASARNAAIKAEIDMLHMAIMNYKNEYGSFPPVFDSVPLPPASPTTLGIVNRHVRKLFPRILVGVPPGTPDNRVSPVQISALFDTDLTRNPTRETRALVPWLMGFTNDPTDPLDNNPMTPPGRRKKMFDFDQSRIQIVTEMRGSLSVTSAAYHPSTKPRSPYVYIPASQYKALPYLQGSTAGYGAHRLPSLPLVPGGATNFAFINLATAEAAPSDAYANPDTFQILCAGRDEEFGTDDDLSNFWPGTRREYLDSLKN
jgi:hypothetical protein